MREKERLQDGGRQIAVLRGGSGEEEGASRKWSEKAGGFRCCGDANMQSETETMNSLCSVCTIAYSTLPL